MSDEPIPLVCGTCGRAFGQRETHHVRMRLVGDSFKSVAWHSGCDEPEIPGSPIAPKGPTHG